MQLLSEMNTPLKSINQISHIALDIETVPNRPFTDYELSVQDYINRKLAKARDADPEMTYEKFASLNLSFGRIICLSFGCINENIRGEQVAVLKSYTGDEKDSCPSVCEEPRPCFISSQPIRRVGLDQSRASYHRAESRPQWPAATMVIGNGKIDETTSGHAQARNTPLPSRQVACPEAPEGRQSTSPIHG